MSDVILTNKDYQAILNRRFGVERAKLVKATMKPLSDNVEGFMGEHYKLSITYEENGEEKVDYLFVKTKPRKNLTQRQLTEDIEMYSLEIFVNGFLFREYEKCGFDTSFSPKCWYYVEEETFVMEDLAVQGYSLAERGHWFDLEMSKCGLRALALLHAAGIMYEEIKSKQLKRQFVLEKEYPKIFKERYYTFLFEFRCKPIEDWIIITIQLFDKIIDHLPESLRWKEDFKKRLHNREIGKIFVEQTGIRKTFGHGDLWSNNLLFKMENGVAKECCLLDYQLSRYFYPSYDVMLFLYMNTSADSHATEHPILCQFYYDTLAKILSDHGFQIDDYYPKEDFKKSLDLVEFETKLQAYSVRAFVTLPQEQLNEGVHGEEDGISKLLYDDRIANTINVFNSDEAYRKLVMGDLYALHDCLCKK